MEAATAEAPVKPSRKGLKKYGKSRVGNGNALLPGIDGRSVWVRRLKDVITEYSRDVDDASAAQRAMIFRAAAATVELERLEARFAAADKTDPAEVDVYVRSVGHLRRLLETIGLPRTTHRAPAPGDTELSLADFIRHQVEK
jgi:hypothetical protein